MVGAGAAKNAGFDPERLARIEPFLRHAYLEPAKLPMMQLLVARDGVPVHHLNLGTMGEGREALREDALFRIASMTKPVTSVAALRDRLQLNSAAASRARTFIAENSVNQRR